MDFLQLIVGIIATVIAVRAITLQKYEIIKNGRITALIHTSNMIQDKINYHSRIIDGLKVDNKPWEGHAARINKEFRPLKEKVDFELLDLMGRHEGITQIEEIKVALKSKKS